MRWIIMSALVAAGIIAVGATAALAQIGARAGPSLIAIPAAIPMHGSEVAEFAGSGFAPGEIVRISITDQFGLTWDITSSVTPIPLEVNTAGAFVGQLKIERWATRSIGEPGPLSLNVTPFDDHTNILATTPLILCPADLKGQQVSLSCEPTEAPEDMFLRMAEELGLLGDAYIGIVYELNRFAIEDNLFQLRMGSEPYWGYAAEERPDSTQGDGLVMTINLGDTIKFDRLGTSGSRSTKDHHFTITELGIDITLTPGERIEPYELKPDKAGEFVIFDSEDPDGHGKTLLIVNEPPGGGG